MSVLGDVFGSLRSMTQEQLLLAFIACISYGFAQGSLLPARGRHIAWLAAVLSAASFAFMGADWTNAVMLLGFAIVGMGSFVAGVWLTGRALGFGRATTRTDAEATESGESAFGTAAAPGKPRGARSSGHAHSL